MTLAVRNALFVFGIVVALCLIAAFAIVAYQLWATPQGVASLALPNQQEWLLFSWDVSRAGVSASIVSVGAAGLVALLGSLTSARLFRRVSSQEIYFITLALLCFTVETVRIGQLLFDLYPIPSFFRTLLTRALLVSRLMGAFSLFAAGVYNAGAEYPRIGTVSVLLLLLSGVIVYLVPVDQDRLQATLIHATWADGGIDALLLFLGLGTAVNYAIGWRKGYHERGGLVFAAITLFVAGRLFLQVFPSLPAGVAGALFLATGTTIVVSVNRSYHLWY